MSRICRILAFEADNLAHRVGPARLRVDAVERGARADQIEMVVAAEKDPGRSRQARRHAGHPAASRQKVVRAARGSADGRARRRRRDGSSAPASGSARPGSRSSASRSNSRLVKPRRAIPVSTCNIAGNGPRAAATPCHSAIWPGSLSTGTRRAAANSAPEPGTRPFSTAISHRPGRVLRNASASSSVATKNRRQPAAASALATTAAPRP